MSDIEHVAQLLRTWDVLKSIGITEVFATEEAFYLRGPALKLERSLQQSFKFEFNESFARHFGIEIQVNRWPNSWQVRDTRPQWFQIDARDGLHISAVLEGIESAVNSYLGAEEGYSIEMIVEPGYPWPGRDVDYYSAKEKKWYRSSKPDAAIRIDSRKTMDEQGDVWGLNFCEILPSICPTNAPKAVIGDINGLEYMVTHASPVMESKMYEANYDILRKCGGMIFPSLATGEIPAANFGEAILVAHPGSILPSLAPYKQRGSYPILTYPSDVWTEVARDFVDGRASIQAFTQLYGGENYMYASHFWILGPSVKEEGFADEPTKPLTSTNSLRSAIRKRSALWRRDLDEGEFEELADRMTAERYGYLESKSHVIMDWKCFVLAAAPIQFLSEVQKRLEAYGYSGDLIGVEVPDEVASSFLPNNKVIPSKANYLRFQYAWAAADAIRAYAHENNLIMNVAMK